MKSPNVLIVGRSGAGKSTSIRNLDPETTAVIVPENKMLPFRERERFEKIVFPETFSQGESAIHRAIESDEINTVVIDSLSGISDMLLASCENQYSGYEVYNAYQQKMRHLLLQAQKSEKLVIWFGIEEYGAEPVPYRKMRLEGKRSDGVEKYFVIVLWSEAVRIDDEMHYRFVTQNDGMTTCKSPMGMFPDLHIPNDLALVKNLIEEYE